MVYAFIDDREASTRTVKNLGHAWIAKDHSRMTFVRKEGRESDLAKKYNVASFPTLVFVAPALKDGERVIEKKGGEMSLKSIRAVQKRGFERIKKALEKR